MAFDYKKEYKEFYLPSRKPHLITVPPMNFVTVQGRGDPNDPAGEYQAAMEVLYGLAYTIKMSYKGSHRMEGFFEYVVPPLEGLWHQQGVDGVDYAHKETFEWTSMIRLPEFVLKSPTGAFIVPLRSTNANLSGRGPSILLPQDRSVT